MIPFNYHHLYYFYIIAQEGSISKATEILRLAQPTLSAQLKQFEEFLNVKLFIRDKRKLILTEEGHQVLSYAKTIFDIGQELKNRMVNLSESGRPHIQIGATNLVPKTIIELLICFIMSLNKNTYIELKEDRMNSLMTQLEDHLLDIVLTDTPFETNITNNISSTFIGKSPIVFCAHQSIANKIKQMPDDLNKFPLILPAAPRQIFFTLKEYLYEHNIKPNIIGEIEDIEIVRRMALRGYGIAPLNLLTALEAPSSKKLVIIEQSMKTNLFEKVYLISKNKKQPNQLVDNILKNFRLEI